MINNKFAIFEPIILPTAILPSFFLAAAIETVNSGNDVPIAIALIPTIVLGTLKKFAKKTKLDNSPWLSDGDYFDTPKLFKILLDLIYSGNEKSAWEFLDMTWPKTKLGKEQFKKDFLDNYNKS